MSGTLYARLGGYDAIAAVADDLVPRLQSDALLAFGKIAVRTDCGERSNC